MKTITDTIGVVGRLSEEINSPVTVTIGIAQFGQNANDTTEACIKRADEALYVGKHNGHNRVEMCG
jgi:PleD family two-component response regulator